MKNQKNTGLLYGLLGFVAGSVFMAVVLITYSAVRQTDVSTTTTDNSMASMSMDDMTTELKGKTGDAFDAAFIAMMIEHHAGAIEMAKLAEDSAKHDEIKQLSKDIISAQDKEISQMAQWQKDWGYGSYMMDHGMMGH